MNDKYTRDKSRVTLRWPVRCVSLTLEGTRYERSQVTRRQSDEAMCALLGTETINECSQKEAHGDSGEGGTRSENPGEVCPWNVLDRLGLKAYETIAINSPEFNVISGYWAAACCCLSG